MAFDGRFLFRKALHLLLGALFLRAIAYALDAFGAAKMRWLLGALLVAMLLVEYWRIEYGLPLVHVLVKESERFRLHAGTFAVIAAFIVFALFEERIAFAVMALSIVGDAAAAVIGKLAGTHHPPWNAKKTWEGYAAYVLLGGAAAASFLPLPVVFALAALAGFIELGCRYGEDNFLAPILAAYVASLLV